MVASNSMCVLCIFPFYTEPQYNKHTGSVKQTIESIMAVEQLINECLLHFIMFCLVLHEHKLCIGVVGGWKQVNIKTIKLYVALRLLKLI